MLVDFVEHSQISMILRSNLSCFRQVEKSDGERRARKAGAKFLEVSAKSGKHVDDFLKQVSEAAIEELLGGRYGNE